MNQNHLKRTLSLVLAFVMMITLVPLGSFTALADPATPADANQVQHTTEKQTGKTKLKTSHVGLSATIKD